MYRLIPLALVLAACDHDCDDTDVDTSDIDTSDVDTSDPDTDTNGSAVDYPDYPSESGGNEWVGVVWTDATGGPLGDETYIGSPREVNFNGTRVYSQTDELIVDQAELTWTFDAQDGVPGEYYVDDNSIFVYSSDDNTTNLTFTGWVRVDAFDASAQELRMVLVGDVTGSTGTSPVSVAVDIAPGAM